MDNQLTQNSVTFAGGKSNWDCNMFETGVEALVVDATSQYYPLFFPTIDTD